MKKLFIWLSLGCSIVASAQTITVMDVGSSSPIEMAAIISEKSNVYATTNAKGKADITAFAGLKAIEIRSLGYKSQTMSFARLEAAGFNVFLEVSNLSLDEVVVSGTRWRQSSGSVPTKIFSLPSKEVVLQNPQNAADLLGISGKVYVQKSQQGGGSPMIRGYSANRLLYTVDGIRMNTAIFRGGNLQNVISLDALTTERVEVLFGPGTVIYGSDAIGGVMGFHTLTPQLSLTGQPFITGKAVTRYSSANKEKTGHFSVSAGWKKWAMLTSITSSEFNHLRQGSHGPEDYLKPFHVQRIDSIDRVLTQDDPLLQVPSAYSQINFMQKVRFRANENWDLQYGFHYSETSAYGRYDRHTRMRNGTARYAEWDYGPQKWMMNLLSITHTGSTRAYDQIAIRLAHQVFGESRIDRSLNNNKRNTQAEEVMAMSVNTDFRKALGSRHSLNYGIEYVNNEVTSSGFMTDISKGTDKPGPSRYPQATWQSLAVYASDDYKLSEKVLLQAGLRFNQYIMDAVFDTTFFPFPFTKANISSGAISGSLGGVYRPDDTWVISARIGTAFRSPNVDDLGKVFDSEPGKVTVPNPGLKAEYAYSAEAGVAKVFGEVLKLDITAYYSWLENAMVRRDYQLNGRDSILYQGEMSRVQAILNAANANVYGLQAGLEVKLPAGFSFSSDLNYQIGEEELDDGSTSPSRHAAPLFGQSRLSFNPGKMKLQFYAVYQGKRSHDDLADEEKGKDEIYAKDENGNNYAPAWYTLNFKAMYQLSETITMTAGLENITDRRYRPYSSGISGPGRNFVLALRANF
jgi:hemoglobin/transferrin/lactoferrin receptor protein